MSTPPQQAKTDPSAGSSCDPGSRECPLVRQIFTLNNIIMRIGDRMSAPIGLTSSRWMLLCLIERAGDSGATASGLSAEGNLSVQNVSRMLAAMESEGLLTRDRIPGEGRTVYVRLTERGEAAAAATKGLAERFRAELFRDIPERDLDALAAGLDRLISNTERFERQLTAQDDAQDDRKTA